jgi:sec-independent protein translocase protein TatB
MEILGIGPSELIFIIVIALIVLGPKDMQKAGKSIGRYLNKIVKSDGWKAFQQTSREIRDLPTNLMREANMDLAETEKEIRKSMKMPPLPGTSLPQRPDSNSAVEPSPNLSQPQEAENSILPPSATDTEPDITIETPSDTPDDKVSPPNQNA